MDAVGAPTRAVAVLEAARVPHHVHRYEHDPSSAAYGAEAAAAMGVDAARVFKTLVASVDGTLVVAVVPVTGQLDLKALASAVGGKAAPMADPAAAERTTGYMTGGISPLGQKRLLPTVVDQSASRWETVFVSGGRRGLEIELAADDLVRLTNGTVATIGRER